MSVIKNFNAALGGLWLTALTCACGFEGNGIEVSGAWARATVPGQTVAAAYMNIKSQDDSRLIGVASERARSVEIHSMAIEDGMMRMRELETLELPAHTTIRLEPKGNHLMLLGLDKPLNLGEKFPLELTVEKDGRRAETLVVTAEVRAALE